AVVAAVRLAHVEEGVEAAIGQRDQRSAGELLRAAAGQEAVGVAPEEERRAPAVPGPEEAVGAQIVVAQKKHRRGLEGLDPGAQLRVLEAQEVMRPRVPARVADE